MHAQRIHFEAKQKRGYLFDKVYNGIDLFGLIKRSRPLYTLRSIERTRASVRPVFAFAGRRGQGDLQAAECQEPDYEVRK